MKRRFSGNGRRGRYVSGFTLVELVIAIAVFAVLATLSYGGLRIVLDSQEYTAQHADRLARLQLAYRIINQDFQQIVNRGIRNAFGDWEKSFIAGTDGNHRVEFSRGGWRNPAGRLRSTLQRVGYRVDENELLRESWRVLDRAQDSKPREQPLLEGVEALQMRFLDDQDAWHEVWPPLNQAPPAEGAEDEGDPMPRGVELVLELEDWGELKWLFQVTP